MKHGLFKNTLRKVGKTFGRFVSILSIIAIGCAFFSGLKASSGYMKNSADKFLKNANTADFLLKSSIGFTEEDFEKVTELDNIECAEKSFSIDLIDKRENENIVLSVKSYNENSTLNALTLKEGRYPENKNECLADASAYKCEDFEIGETISLYSADDISEIIDNTEYTVVGLVRSPLNLSDERGSTTVGNGILNGYLYVPEENFISEYYTDIYLKFKSLDNINAFSDEYKDKTDEISGLLEDFSAERQDISAENLKSKLEETINENKQKLEDAETEYNDGKTAYDDAVKQLESGKAELNSKTSDLETAKKEYEKNFAEFEDSQNKLTNVLNACSSVDALLERYSDKYAKEIPSDVLEDINTIQTSFDEFSGLSGNAQSETIGVKVKDMLSNYITSQSTEEKNNLSLQITAINDTMKSSAGTVTTTLGESSEALLEAERSITDANSQISEYNAELKESELKLSETSEDLQSAKEEIDLAKKELEDAQNEIDEKVSNAKWYVFSRYDFLTAFEDYGPDCDRVDNVAKIFPLFFILLSALVCICTMTRMIEEQRTESGTFKALGIGSGSITFQYIIYAAAASILGSVIGVCVGLPLIPKAIYYAYSSMYDIPNFTTPFDFRYLVGCIIVSIMCTSLSALIVCSKELKESPAQLMRPKAPKSGKKVFLEKVPSIWSKLSFTVKVTFRNLFRYKSRFLMAIVGIMGSTALLLAGFALKYDISEITEKQFGEIMKYDAAAAIDTDSNDTSSLDNFLDSSEDIVFEMKAYMSSQTIKSGKSSVDECTVTAPDDIGLLDEFITLKERKSGNKLYVPMQGAIINEKLASLLSVKTGDTIYVGENETECIVSGITENYIGNYVYVTKDTALNLLGENTDNTVLLKLSESSDRNSFSEEILSVDGVLGISYITDGTEKFATLIESLNLVILLIIVFSGALCFVILINLAEINISERNHELATLKVLGFFDGEVSSYLYRENVFSTIIGIILGLPSGVGLLRIVVYFAEANSVMFAREIPAYCFGTAAAMTVCFAIIVSIATHFRLIKIDMASSLKAIE